MGDAWRILVVDDEESLCRLYKEELESEGYAVRTVNDAREAVRIVRADPPDAVVMDIRMPSMDGIEAMGLMLGLRSDLPVVLNSAYASHKDDFRSWPARAYVTKSSDLGELKRTLRLLLRAAVSAA